MCQCNLSFFFHIFRQSENIKKSKPEYTQSFVAKEIGVARTTYTAYENGTKMPPIDTLSNIAKLLMFQ
ncbi:helix-turn-helix domain-containing protein [Lysinibacillus sp. NPDC093197]|uniref:helix-turn-helix domain-containing protein n=1 Tax=Lysinibacillus sp. NPDC093197 TaxID=3364132 RepID=UPI003824550B